MGLLILFNNLQSLEGVAVFGSEAPELRQIRSKIENRIVRKGGRSIIQQPSEYLDYQFNYEDHFPAGDNIASSVVSAAPSGLTLGTKEESGQTVTQWTSGGVNGTTYVETGLATSSAGRIKELEFDLVITDSVSRHTIQQQPAENLDYDFNFSNAFPEGDDVLLAAVTATPSGLTLGTKAYSGQKVKQWISGAAGTYVITCIATSVAGRIKELEFNLVVSDV